MLSPEIKKIAKKNERYTKMLEYFDSTGKLPSRKTRRSFTITKMDFDKLKDASKRRGRSMSDILDELIEYHL